ncbi:MAG: hypothetical protein PHP17_00360 [Candidatus Omnitrophica bacterium]|nr:hypothetical protein [Candidatus Omnitrophota bacterium]
MYIELLKKIYFEERKKLEGMWIHKQEMKLKVIQFRKQMLERLEGCLSISEISGRNDIHEEVKDRLLRDAEHSDQLQSRLEFNLGDERKKLEEEEKQELNNANYNSVEYADYLFQAEKVYMIEAEMAEKGLYPEAVYQNGQKNINE